jgi:hypothetical protein
MVSGPMRRSLALDADRYRLLARLARLLSNGNPGRVLDQAASIKAGPRGEAIIDFGNTLR